MSSSPQPFVSVVIPVFDNAEGLRRCLGALADQGYWADRYEVVVVDNGSREDLAPWVAGFPLARLVRESQPGSYAARNRGLAVARGEVFAFTDSDCVPAPDWIERGVASLSSCSNCGFVAGHVELSFRDPARPTAAELYDFIVMNFHQDRNVAERQFGATANLFAPKSVFDAVGTFDGALLSGGDLEWGRRVFAHGYHPIYAKDVRVTHPARHSLAETYRRARRLVGGSPNVGSSASAARRLVALARAFTPALGFYARILGDRRLPRIRDRVRVVLVALGVKYVCAWELIRLTLGGAPHRG